MFDDREEIKGRRWNSLFDQSKAEKQRLKNM